MCSFIRSGSFALFLLFIYRYFLQRQGTSDIFLYYYILSDSGMSTAIVGVTGLFKSRKRNKRAEDTSPKKDKNEAPSAEEPLPDAPPPSKRAVRVSRRTSSQRSEDSTTTATSETSSPRRKPKGLLHRVTDILGRRGSKTSTSPSTSDRLSTPDELEDRNKNRTTKGRKKAEPVKIVTAASAPAPESPPRASLNHLPIKKRTALLFQHDEETRTSMLKEKKGASEAPTVPEVPPPPYSPIETKPAVQLHVPVLSSMLLHDSPPIQPTRHAAATANILNVRPTVIATVASTIQLPSPVVTTTASSSSSSSSPSSSLNIKQELVTPRSTPSSDLPTPTPPPPASLNKSASLSELSAVTAAELIYEQLLDNLVGPNPLHRATLRAILPPSKVVELKAMFESMNAIGTPPFPIDRERQDPPLASSTPARPPRVPAPLVEENEPPLFIDVEKDDDDEVDVKTVMQAVVKKTKSQKSPKKKAGGEVEKNLKGLLGLGFLVISSIVLVQGFSSLPRSFLCVDNCHLDEDEV